MRSGKDKLTARIIHYKEIASNTASFLACNSIKTLFVGLIRSFANISGLNVSHLFVNYILTGLNYMFLFILNLYYYIIRYN